MHSIKRPAQLTALALISLGAVGNASAQEKEVGSGPNPYTDCGIGAALFPDTHWAAVTSNVIWDLGTTAITSATASPETCQDRSAKAARFINETYDSVVEETARGEGEHLTALLEIYGCVPAAHRNVISSIRPAVGEVIASEDYSAQTLLEKSEQYFHLIDNEVKTTFADNCSA